MTKRKRTSIFVLLAAATLLIVGGIALAQGTFPDVPEDDAHFDNIEWAAENGVVNGFTDGTFKPYQSVARGQVATMIRNYDDYLQSLNLGQAACGDCHDDTSLITGKQATWAESNHGMNTSFARGTGAGCAGCHSGGEFQRVVEAGLNVHEASADPDPTRQDCRTCHQIHETGTGADWALETTAAVPLSFVPDVTYDGGRGNLCANCHQPRRTFPEPNEAGIVTGISEHWGPHHGPQAATLLGVAGAGVAEEDSVPMAHYNVPDTCVTCHTPDVRSHLFAADMEACATPGCHGNAQALMDELQSEVITRLDVIAGELLSLGLIEVTTEPGVSPIDGHPSVTQAPVDQAVALYNWLYIVHEDKSFGVHNGAYTRAMLDAAEAALGIGAQ
jgi:hypothetical protein